MVLLQPNTAIHHIMIGVLLALYIRIIRQGISFCICMIHSHARLRRHRVLLPVCPVTHGVCFTAGDVPPDSWLKNQPRDVSSYEIQPRTTFFSQQGCNRFPAQNQRNTLKQHSTKQDICFSSLGCSGALCFCPTKLFEATPP